MKKIKELLNTIQDREISDYCVLSSKIKPLINNELENCKKIKIALLSSFTTRFIEDVLFIKCLENGINAQIYLCNYNQYSQDIIDEKSAFYSFKPDLTILFVDIRHVLGDLFFFPYKIKSNDKRAWVEEQINDFELLVNKIQSNISTKLLIHNLEIPTYSPFGILENKQEFGYLESIEYFNMKLREKYKLNNQTFIFDYNLFCSGIGKNNIFDYKLYYLSDIKLKLETIPLLCNEYLRYIKPIASILKKCIVLDLDNTLWGGIVGEDGFDGIKLGPTGQGKPFYEFQKHLLALYNRGVILAINSKNNYEDAMKVITEHPYMILKENHFASIQINWDNKVTNMRIIASEINIGLDSLVFFDDDLLNREMVSTELPEITVVNMPSDPVYYVDSLIELKEFNNLQITNEDFQKGQFYSQQRKRNELKKSTTDIEKYLKKLQICIWIENSRELNIARISQLTQKTNQFNLTTRRYSEKEITDYINCKNNHIYSIKVKDKFGDNGITGLIMINEKDNDWIIHNFLISCRIIGRNIENAFIASIIKEAKKKKIRKIIGEYIPTRKNILVKTIYNNLGFDKINVNNEVDLWEFDVEKKVIFPEYIKVENY